MWRVLWLQRYRPDLVQLIIDGIDRPGRGPSAAALYRQGRDEMYRRVWAMLSEEPAAAVAEGEEPTP